MADSSLSLSFFTCVNKEKTSKFDGNFEHAYAKSGGSGSGTTRKIDLGEEGLLSDNEVDELEDDGMGGILGAGPEDGGIITPYSFQPAPASVGGTAVSQHQLEPQMRQISKAALATHPNRK